MHRDPPHLRGGGGRPTRSPRRLRPSSKPPRWAIRAQADTRMGPVVTRGQQAAAFDGIRRLASEAAIVCGGADAPALDGIDGGRSAFVAPTLLQLKDAGAGERRARGRSLRPRRNRRALSRRAGCRRAGRARRRLAGRFGLRRGPGVSRPHGGRDRAEPRAAAHGRPVDRERPYRPRHRHAAMQSRRSRPRRGGEELGGLYGLRFYHQRLAVQGSSDLLAELQTKAASLH